MKRKITVLMAILGLISAIGLALTLGATNNSKQNIGKSLETKVFVGDHLHTLSINGAVMTITGHESAAISKNFGVNWDAIATLDGAEVMAWTANGSKEFAGGQYVYLASPAYGLLSSQDGGESWLPLNTKIGQGFMGSMLVAPSNPLKVLAPDMQLGLMSTIDGGKSWQAIGGPIGTMSIAWNPTNVNEITVLGMSGAQSTKDGGTSWVDISTPLGAAAFAYANDGKELYVAVLDDAPYGHVLKSADRGMSWSKAAGPEQESSNNLSKVAPKSEMEPNMPGMDHSTPEVNQASGDRPLGATLGVFGLASSIAISSAFFLKRKDKRAKDLNHKVRNQRSTTE